MLVVSACSWLCVFMVCVPGVCMFLVYARQWCVCYRSMHVPGVCMFRQYMGPCEWRVRGSCLSHGCPTVGGSIPTLPHGCGLPCLLLSWELQDHPEGTATPQPGGRGLTGRTRELVLREGKGASTGPLGRWAALGPRGWSGPGAPDTLGSGLWAHAQPPIKG